jgi:UDP-N-acetyl-D-mannosaminuronic acid transferase (WecB/TagA/CpsF family)
MDEPPAWMQRSGLQWAYRLAQDPRRLWKRYLKLNPAYLARLGVQFVTRRPKAIEQRRPESEVLFG